MIEIAQVAADALERVRRAQPLVHILSNFVTMNDVANATLAIGARPIMAHAAEEVAEITPAARALVLNLGTPSPERVRAMLVAGRAANAHNIPIVFDPVGVGVSAFRRESAAQILNTLRVAVTRGNAAEIGALAGIGGAASGVDAGDREYDRARVASVVAATHRTVAVISGAVDYVSDASRTAQVANGALDLQRISGAGDMLDALIGAALTVEKDALVAALSGLVWLGVAAEQAALAGKGIGTFRSTLFDTLDRLDGEVLLTRAKITFSVSL